MSKFLSPVFVAAFGVSSLAFVASAEAEGGCGSFQLQTVSTPEPVTTASGESTTPIVVPPSPSG